MIAPISAKPSQLQGRRAVGHGDLADGILEVVLGDVHQVGVHLAGRLERQSADAEHHLILRKQRVAGCRPRLREP